MDFSRGTSASCGPASMNIQIYSTAGPYPQPYLLVISTAVRTYWTGFRLCGTFDCKLKFRNQDNNIAFIFVHMQWQ